MLISMAESQVPVLPKYISRGRRPFLVPEPSYRSHNSSSNSHNNALSRKLKLSNGNDAAELGRSDERGELDMQACRWKRRTQVVINWMRSNPLNLGLDDDSVRVIKEQLQRGKQANGNQAVEEKCWKHICVEFETVPGNPTKDCLEIGGYNPTSKSTREKGVQAGPSATSAHLPSIQQQQSGVLPETHAGFPEHNFISRSDNQSSRSETGSTSTISSSRDVSSSKPKRAPIPTGKPHRSSKQSRRRFHIPLGKDHIYLSKMTMLERQEYCLSRKKQREESKRRQREEQEKAACAYDPKRFTRRSEFSNVESIVKKIVQSPSPSPGGRRKKFPEAFAQSPSHATLPNNHLINDNTTTATTAAAEDNLNAETVILDTPSADTLPSNRPSEKSKRLALGSKRGTRSGSAILPEATAVAKPIKANLLLPARKANANANANVKAKAKVKVKVKDKTKLKSDDAAPQESKLLDSCKLELLQSTLVQDSDLFGAKEMTGSAEEANQNDEGERREACIEGAEPVVQHKHRFLPNSTEYRGKIQLQDHTHFQLDSFYRKRDRGSAKPGVSLMMGRREDDFSEQVVHVVFDRSKFTEGQASEWMERNVHRFKTGPGHRHSD